MTRGNSIRQVGVIAAFLAGCALAGNVHALVLISHTGRSDPVGEGWTMTPADGVATAIGGNDGEDYWSVQVPSAARFGYTVNLSSGDLGHPAGWTATARVKVISGGDIANQTALQVIDGQDRFDIYLSDGSTVPMGTWIKGASADVQISTADPRDGYHTYQIIFDPAGDSGGGTTSYYIDGALLATQTRADAANNTNYRRILWGDNASTGGPSESRWSLARFELGQRPLGVSNDACAHALVVADGSYVTDTTAATNDGLASCGDSSASPDLWYVYTASCNGKVHIDTCDANYDSVVSVYPAAVPLCPAAAANELGCNDNCAGDPCAGSGSCLSVPVLQGDVLLIRVSGVNGTSGNATLNVSCVVDPPPANDACWAAQVVTEGLIAGSTLTATADGDAGCGASSGAPDVWYSFTPTKTGTLRIIKTAASAIAPVVSIHTACPGNETNQLACAANAVLLTNVTKDATYLVRVSGVNGVTGLFALDLSVQESPVVVKHEGLTDPQTEGWSMENVGTGGAPTTGPGHDEEDHWLIQVPDVRRLGYTVNVLAADLQNAGGWTATTRVRVPAAMDSSQAQLQVLDGSDVWAMDFIAGGGTLPRGVYVRVSASAGFELLADVDTATLYHTYQMVYDPAGDGGNGSVSFYVDGALVGARTRAQVPNNTTFRRVLFGDNTAQARGTSSESHWALVQLELGQRVITVCHNPFADLDGDTDVDQVDFGLLQQCFTGNLGFVASRCVCADRDKNTLVDAGDLQAFVNCVSGPAVPANENCD